MAHTTRFPRSRITVVACLTLLSFAAQAAETEPRRDALRDGGYLAPLAAYTRADTQRGLDDGLGYALALGYRADFAAIELIGEVTRLDALAGNSRADLSNLGINVLISPFRALDLYGLIGFGVRDRENHPGFAEDDYSILIDAGLGYMLPLSLGDFDFALRLEGLYRLDTQQPPFPEGAPRKFEDVVGRVGLYLPLGAPPPLPPPPVVAVVPVISTDDDNDGVLNEKDQCPGTAPGVVVDETGCEPPKAPPPPMVLPGVNFETASDRLTAEAEAVLDGVAQNLLSQPVQSYEVSGHTDSVGDDDYNQDLSQRRAESVRRYLGEHGVNAGTLTAAGYGESRPIASNDTVEGRAQNRRVELQALGAEPSAEPAPTTP